MWGNKQSIPAKGGAIARHATDTKPPPQKTTNQKQNNNKKTEALSKRQTDSAAPDGHEPSETTTNKNNNQRKNKLNKRPEAPNKGQSECAARDGHDLLGGAGDACRVAFYLRSTPLDMIEAFVEEFDHELREAFAAHHLTLPGDCSYSPRLRKAFT